MDKPNIVKKIIQNNFSNGRSGNTISGIVIHTEGLASKNNSMSDHSLYDGFNTPGFGASAHFFVTFSGVIEQYVELENTAWHTVGDGNQNVQTVGIEHQDNGYYREGEQRYTQAQIESSAKLVAWLRSLYGFELVIKKAGGVALHRMWETNRECPGALPVQTIIDKAKVLLNPPANPARDEELWALYAKQRPEILTAKDANGNLLYTVDTCLNHWDVWGSYEYYRAYLYLSVVDPAKYPNITNYASRGLLDHYKRIGSKYTFNIWKTEAPTFLSVKTQLKTQIINLISGIQV